MNSRKKLTQDVQTEVLVASRRRCCICFGLHGDLTFKPQGQLAHVDRDPANSDADNLAFMCLEHHDWFDTRPSQSKGPTPEEARRYRNELYHELRKRDEQSGPELPADVALPVSGATGFEPVRVDDDRLTMLWKLRREPSEWLERDVEGMTPLQLMEILDGPFHAAPDGLSQGIREHGEGLRGWMAGTRAGDCRAAAATPARQKDRGATRRAGAAAVLESHAAAAPHAARVNAQSVGGGLRSRPCVARVVSPTFRVPGILDQGLISLPRT